jgi:2-isopropylmalate synthase
MSKERIYLFDTTLRDGQQTPGIDFSVEDKIAIARMLDEFGIDYVEGGYPGRQSDRHCVFCREANQDSVVRGFRHDQAGRRFHLERSRPGRSDPG